jgi:hypothetical protein
LYAQGYCQLAEAIEEFFGEREKKKKAAEDGKGPSGVKRQFSFWSPRPMPENDPA